MKRSNPIAKALASRLFRQRKLPGYRKVKQCQHCRGSGVLHIMFFSPWGDEQTEETRECYYCKGTGEV